MPAPNLIQSVSLSPAINTVVTSQTISFAAVGVGHALCFYCAGLDAVGVTFGDNAGAGNVYTQIGNTYVWVCLNVLGSPTAITVNWGSSGNGRQMAIAEVTTPCSVDQVSSGTPYPIGTPPFIAGPPLSDYSSYNSDQFGPPSLDLPQVFDWAPNTPSVTTTSADELLLCFGQIGSVFLGQVPNTITTVTSPGSGWSMETQSAAGLPGGANAYYNEVFLQSKTVSSVGAYTADASSLATQTGAATGYFYDVGNIPGFLNMTLVSFKVAAGSVIDVVSGSGQNTNTYNEFPKALIAQVLNGGNPVSGVPVTFTSPSFGATAFFQNNPVVITDANGLAVSPELIANGTTGSYSIVATTPSASNQATFALTNTQPAPGPGPGPDGTNYWRFDITCKSPQGPCVSGALVYVLNEPTTNTTSLPPAPLATLYANPLATATLPNPLVTDCQGKCFAYLPTGLYCLVVSFAGQLDLVIPDQNLGVVNNEGQQLPTYWNYSDWIRTAMGQAIPNAVVYVFNQPAVVPPSASASAPPPGIAQIFADRNGLVPVTSVQSNGGGGFSFYAKPGYYTVAAYLPTGQLIYSLPDQSLGQGILT